MKNKLIIFITAILFTSLVISCGKETQATTQGGGTFIVRVKISPSLQTGTAGQIPQSNMIQVWGGGFATTWNGSSQTQSLSEISTDEISVTSGQNLPVYCILNNAYDFNCRTVTIEGLQNGKVIKTFVLNMGQKPGSLMCTDGIQINKNFIIQ